jgi:hypothetical protein
MERPRREAEQVSVQGPPVSSKCVTKTAVNARPATAAVLEPVMRKWNDPGGRAAGETTVAAA